LQARYGSVPVTLCWQQCLKQTPSCINRESDSEKRAHRKCRKRQIVTWHTSAETVNAHRDSAVPIAGSDYFRKALLQIYGHLVVRRHPGRPLQIHLPGRHGANR
jgi:hypothetical protein